MSAHTPGPWRFQCEVETDPLTYSKPRTFYSLYTVSGAYGHPATCDSQADAEFIVRACNAHDDLRQALLLLRLRDDNDTAGDPEATLADCWCPARKQRGRAIKDHEHTAECCIARAAIAKAEGR